MENLNQSRTIISKIISLIWPIKKQELKKFAPMAFMMFCIIFNYSILRSLKDSIVVTEIGAEAVSALKLWGVLPSAILMMIIYAKLLDIFNKKQVFYIVTSFFMVVIALFGFVFYPHAEVFHPSVEKILDLVEAYPNFKWVIFLFGKWSYALFFIIAETWGSFMLSLLFWQFANQITYTSEAKRFYPMFGMLGNFALIFAGSALKSINSINNFVLSLKLFSVLLIAVGLLIMITYSLVNSRIAQQIDPSKIKVAKKKIKPSLKESFKTIFSSKYLGLVAIIVLCYGISINLVEGPWKDRVRELYPTNSQYINFMATFNKITGIVCILFYIVAGNIIPKFKWKNSAILTPIMIFITGLGFYIFVVISSKADSRLAMLTGANILWFSVLFGSIQNILSKATKYSFFDPTKEMTYIPLDDELKTKGKAAVDAVGGRLGKSGGAVIQFLIFAIFPNASFVSVSPYLMMIFIVVTLIWIWAVIKLSKEYELKLKETEGINKSN